MSRDPVRVLGRTNINVTRDGSDDPGAVAGAGFDGIRIPVTIADAGPPTMRYDLTEYLRRAEQLGLKILLVFDRDAFFWPDWRVDTRRYVEHWLLQYAGLFDGIQVGNESDHVSPYSWDLGPEDFSALLKSVRDVAGPDVYLVAGGMASGDPSYLALVDLTPVDAYGLHLYAKDAPNPDDLEDQEDVDGLWHAYERVSPKPAIMTEWGVPGDGGEARQAEEVGDMIAWTARHGAPLYLYNWRDGGQAFGLLRADGRPKAALGAASAAIRALPDLDNPPALPPAPRPGEPQPIHASADPWAFWTARQISEALDVPEANVVEHWPRIVSQLELAGINRRSVQRAVLPTVRIETGGPDRSRRFTPVREAYWLTEAQRAADPTIARYFPYYGRGLVQRTWRDGYAVAGQAIARLWGAGGWEPDFDLVNNPDNLLNPDLAAADLAIFWRDTRALPTASWPLGYSLLDAADAEDTEWIRRLVQGGTASLEELRKIYALLGSAVPGGPVVPIATASFNRSYPPIRQDDKWSCFPTSLRWLLGALGADADGDGRPPTEAYVEGQAVRDGIVSTDLGLLIASGGPAAEWANAQWFSAMGLKATAYGQLDYDGALARANEGGLLLGGRAWNHWTAVAGVTPEGELRLANPDPNWQSVGDVMSRAEFAALGTFSAVAVPIATTDAQEDPKMIAELQRQLAAAQAERDQYAADRARLITYVAVMADDRGDDLQAVVDQLRRDRAEAIGPRP